MYMIQWLMMLSIMMYAKQEAERKTIELTIMELTNFIWIGQVAL